MLYRLGMLPSRMRRLRTFDYTGTHRYTLTFCTLRREPLFTDPSLIEILRSQILRAATESHFDVIAYCFMPDHVHLLVQGAAPAASLTAFVKWAKQRAGYHGQQALSRPIWQSGYHERVLRESEHTSGVVAYILANPVRAGLVTDPFEYPFSGSGLYSKGELMEFVQDGRNGRDTIG